MNISHKIRLLKPLVVWLSIVLVITFTGCGVFSTQTITFPISTASPTIEPRYPGSVSFPAPTGFSTPSVSPSPSPAVSPDPFPTLSVTPSFTPYRPAGAEAELFRYMLDLINQDRRNAGLSSVDLGFNAAAQKHAQDMLDNYYISHWGTDGQKPYMRYTLEGGTNYEQENSAYSGFLITDNPDHYAPLGVKEELKSLQLEMMKEVPPNDGHRQNILNKFHKKVNLGIATDGKRLALVQQFEGEYVDFTLPPTLTGIILSLSGRFMMGTINNVAISYDEYPRTLTTDELLEGPHTYSLGPALGFIIPPPPPGQFYTRLSSKAIMATHWDVDQNGQFSIQADIAPVLASGRGVYTISIIVLIDNIAQHLTNYSLLVE